MAANAQIVIEMDEKGVVRGMQQISAEGQKLEGGLRKVGSRGNVVFTGLARDQQKAHDAANLLNRTLGVQLPRSLERILATSPKLQSALAGAFNGVVAFAFAQAIYTAVEPAIIAVINHLHAFEDALARLEERNAAAANKLLEQSTANIKSLRLRAQLAGAGEVRAIEIKLAEDLADIHRREQEAGRAGSLQAALQLVEEKKALEKAAAAEISAIHVKAERERMEKILQGYQDFLKRRSESMAKFRDEILGATRSQQDAAVQAVIGNLEGEERVNAELELKIALLEELKRKYKGFGQIAESITVQEEQAHVRAAREIAAIRQQQLLEWQQAVQQMASSLERFLDDPIAFLKQAWKRLVLEMVAAWILGQRSMQAATVGGAPGGGFSLGRLLGGLFGLGGGGSSRGGGFSLPSGSAGGVSLPAGVSTTFPSGGSGFQFGQFTPGVAGLAGLPLSAGGGGFGGSLPAGSAQPGILSAFRGNPLSAGQGLLAGGIASGGLLGARAIGFGSPGRAALAGGLAGAGIVGAGLVATFGSAVGSAGAALGSLLLGPLGIGIIAATALIGLLFGVFGRKKKQKQRDEIERQAFRAIEQVETSYKLHQTDYNSAIVQLEQIRQQTDQQMAQLKWPNRMHPHINAAIKRIGDLESERQRRMQIQGGGPMFAQGGFVGSPSYAGGSGGQGFGPLGIPLGLQSSRVAGWQRAPRFDDGGAVQAIVHRGEFVVRKQAVRRAGRAAMERLNATGEMAGGGINITIVAWDGPSVDTYLRNGGAEKIVKEIRRAQREGAF